MINSRAKGTFGIDDDTGKLYIVEKEGSPGYSEYYRDRLVEAINKPDKRIEIRIGNKIKTLTYETETDTFIAEEGEGGAEINVFDEYGGGVNWGNFNGNQLVFISGKDYFGKGATDNNGNWIFYDPADMLLHELLGHAIPKVVGSDTGNAIGNENKARTELGKILDLYI